MRQTIKLKGNQSLRGCYQLISSAENQLTQPAKKKNYSEKLRQGVYNFEGAVG